MGAGRPHPAGGIRQVPLHALARAADRAAGRSRGDGRALKVLHVTQSTGGVETSLRLLFRHLDRSRWDLHLACAPGTGLDAAARELGVAVTTLPLVREPSPRRDLDALRGLVRLIRAERFDMVHGHSAKGGFLARAAARLAGRVPVLYSPRAFSYLSQAGLRRDLFLGMERVAADWTDVLVAASESERRRAIEEVGFPAERAVVVENSVDASECSAVMPLGTPRTVLTVGRLTYQKNPLMFVRMARRVARAMPGTRFVMAGTGFQGEREDETVAAIRDAGLEGRIELLPWAPKDETLRRIAGAAVVVLTSRFEGMPNVVLEAMMLGRPIVVTDVDGSRDAIAHGRTGYLVPDDDDARMAVAVSRLLAQPEAAMRLGVAARAEAARRFDIRRNAAALEQVYERLLAGYL